MRWLLRPTLFAVALLVACYVPYWFMTSGQVGSQELCHGFLLGALTAIVWGTLIVGVVAYIDSSIRDN